MKIGFYPRIAIDGIRKNKRLYFPYILTGCMMVMMFYILSFLSGSSLMSEIPGGATARTVLALGPGIVGFFSLLFLFYTNSFLIRRRYREFGLYNVLGMNKKNIGLIMVFEEIFVAVCVIGFGLILGILLSKLAELGLLNLLHQEISYQFSVEPVFITDTCKIYGGIFLILLLSSLWKVRRSKPLQLMQSDKAGERPPKGNFLFALLGVLLLGVAYYLAVSIDNPLSALSLFFVAVIMVIAATYLIFISASVVLCRLLQKNKSYYYKPNHFVSVSSMAYRMKRNGAGLASICILLTMVLVTISFTASLYFGAEDMIEKRYPRDVNIEAHFLGDTEKVDADYCNQLAEEVKLVAGDTVDFHDYRAGEVAAFIAENGVFVESGTADDAGVVDAIKAYDQIGILQVIPLADYNRAMGTRETLADDECLIYSARLEYLGDTFSINNGKEFEVKKVLDDFIVDGGKNSMAVSTVVVVVDDMVGILEPLLPLKDRSNTPMVQFFWKCGFDVDGDDDYAIAVAEKVDARMDEMASEGWFRDSSTESRAGQHEGYYGLFGCLFFIGILLSFIFLVAAVMIIYYKQISEGYEDRFRFAIMQKVGMTKKEIRKSINSQILTVFILPILVAGIHLAFAFPLLWNMLILFQLSDMVFAIIVTAISFACFALFYAVVYKITSNSYYDIVSSGEE